VEECQPVQHDQRLVVECQLALFAQRLVVEFQLALFDRLLVAEFRLALHDRRLEREAWLPRLALMNHQPSPLQRSYVGTFQSCHWLLLATNSLVKSRASEFARLSQSSTHPAFWLRICTERSQTSPSQLKQPLR